MSLELIPHTDLVFKGPFNIVSTTTLKLANTGDERLAYKIKTTAPKRYCVKPNSGFLEPNANANIQVMLQPPVAGQVDDRSKHKFMVQWVTVPKSDYTGDVDNFWKQDLKGLNIQDSKLRCAFADEQLAAVVPNDSQGQRELDVTDSTNLISNRSQQQSISSSSNINQGSSPTTSRAINLSQTQNQDHQQAVNDDFSRPRFKQEIDQLKYENEILRQKLNQQDSGLRLRASGGSPAIDRFTSKSQQQHGLTLFGIGLNEQHILMAFVVALLFGFSLGYFLFSCSN